MNSPLLTDLYQLTMGYGYWKNNMAAQDAIFHLFYRRAPFGEKGAIAAGIETAIDYLENLHFTKEELAYLKTLKGHDDKALFDQGYIDYLHEMKWTLNVKAVPEGELTFPHEPLLQIQGPLIQCQLVETALLNIVNFQTLIATKAARICEAAGDDPVLEFGLRRAQGPDGGVCASRAAYIGGCVATSNVLAGMKYDIPIKGTHAHSWVMSFDTEEEAFEKYAQAMPNNTLLLVDTYDTIEGVKAAIKIGHRLREKGHDLLGIRLDSGDLAQLSIDARKILDEHGFPNAAIVASNDLDEYSIRKLKDAGAKIDTWGIGTKLVTAYDQPALGGVYKLGAIKDSDGTWQYRIKLSEDLVKVSNPGRLQVARETNKQGHILKDIIFNELDDTQVTGTPLLKSVIINGKRANPAEDITTVQARAVAAWKSRPADTPVTLHPSVEETKRELLKKHGFTPNEK